MQASNGLFKAIKNPATLTITGVLLFLFGESLVMKSPHASIVLANACEHRAVIKPQAPESDL